MTTKKKTWVAPSVAPLTTAKDAQAALGVTGDGVIRRSRLIGS